MASRRLWMVGLFRTAGGEHLALFSGPSGQEIWAGPPGEPMTAHPVTRQRVFRDGGSLEYVTEAGFLFVPAERREDASPTWQGSEVMPLEPDAYAVDHIARTVRVMP